ncbi:MAG TPA: APC family permease [Acidimicrobiales bacterium]|nr:APC family permease [Acidimicrobiales bacterium]
MTDTLEAPADDASQHSLRPGVLGLFDSVIMGIAGVAPGYSIAGTTAILFAAVFLGSAAALLYCGVAMFGIVFAFSYLGRVESNAGASYSWVRRALHPVLGFLSGWALVVSALIFMVIATVPAGANILGLFSTGAANNKVEVTLVGAVFFLLMVAAVAAGVTITVTVQIVMSSIEIVILLLFAALAIFHAHHVHTFSWHWFSPSVFHGQSGFVGGALVAAFYYWGWDVTANLNEETKSAKKTPGLGAIIGIIFVFLLFEVFTIATNMVLTSGQIQANSADVLSVLGQQVWHGNAGKIIVLAVVLSTIATLETTLIQVTRTLFAMGRDNTLPRRLGTVNAKRKTPIVATFVVMVISLALFVGSQAFHSINSIMTDGVNAIALQICIYYCLAGLAVVMLYRRQLLLSASNFVFMGLWPFVGAVFMAYLFVKAIPNLYQSNQAQVWIGLGAMALGLIPMFYYWAKHNPYYTMPAKEDRIAVLEELEQNL